MNKQVALINKYSEQRQELKAAKDYEGLAKLPKESNLIV